MPFRPDSPVELPSGRLVCGTHRLKVCPVCTVDYSFMDEILGENKDSEDEDSEDEDSEDEDFGDEDTEDEDTEDTYVIGGGPTRPRVGTGRVIPTKFHPPSTSDTPQSLFPPAMSFRASPPVRRFIHPTNSRQFLIYTDGACLDNGSVNPKAGCGFVFSHSSPQHPGLGSTCFRLENRGPTGEVHPQTSNRAELRAVIAALRFRAWPGEGFNSLVIATDSEYVVEGVTSWVRGWLRRGWKTSMGAAVKNRDLWENLLGEIELWHDYGLQVKFWRIPRAWNTDADYHARHAASKDTRNEFANISGILV